jgi:tetratricopeptide (TPR) repeat protein
MIRVLFPSLILSFVLSACTAAGPRAEDETDMVSADSADYHVLMAEMALQRHEFEVAAREYSQAIRKSDDPELAERAGRIVLQYGSHEESVAAAEHWIEIDPEALEPRRQLALLRLQRGQVGKALPHLEFLYEAVREESDQGFVLLLPMLMESRDEAAALQALERLARQHPDDATAHYAVGFLALRVGQLQKALEESETSLTLRPDWPEAAVLRARALLADGQSEAAMNLLQDWEGFRNNPSLRLEYAILQLAAGRPEEARLELELLLSDYPRHPGALRTLGLLEYQQGNYELAKPYLVELMSTGRFLSDSLFYLGSIAEIEGDLDGAASLYARVTDGDNTVTARIRLSLILYRLGRQDEALRSLEHVPGADPALAVDLIAARGELLMRMQRFDEALALYDRELARYPDDAALLYARAFLYERMDRVDDAVSELRQLLKRSPDDPVALNALGYTLADRTTRYEEALGYISRAYERSPNSPAITDSMGWVNYRLGNMDEAIKYLREAWALDRDPEIASHLGEVLWSAGEREEAEQIWFESLEENPESKVLHDVIERLMP